MRRAEFVEDDLVLGDGADGGLPRQRALVAVLGLDDPLRLQQAKRHVAGEIGNSTKTNIPRHLNFKKKKINKH